MKLYIGIEKQIQKYYRPSTDGIMQAQGTTLAYHCKDDLLRLIENTENENIYTIVEIEVSNNE